MGLFGKSRNAARATEAALPSAKVSVNGVEIRGQVCETTGDGIDRGVRMRRWGFTGPHTHNGVDYANGDAIDLTDDEADHIRQFAGFESLILLDPGHGD